MTKEKTLSQQICELCGMKPRYKYIVKGQSTELTVDKDWLIWKFKNRKSKSVFKVIKAIKTYLDFENPENFVKLLELKFQYSSFRIDTFSYPKRNGFVQDTLENILGELIKFKSNEKDFIKAIRDYDGWVWG